MHRNSTLIFQKHVLPLIQPGMRLLEVGAPWGKSAYRELLPAGVEYYFCDVKNAGAELPGFVPMSESGYTIGGDFGHYDFILSGQTIEHVSRPWIWMHTLAGMITTVRGHGYVAIICPVTWGFHRHPIDAWRILPDGMRSLFEWAGLEVVHVGMETLDETTADHRYQFNAGPVIDCVGVGRKV